MNSGAIIENSNISLGWIETMDKLLERGVESLNPLIVSFDICQEDGLENQRVRNFLDHALMENDKPACGTTANTIFPNSLWNKDDARSELYKRYIDILPRLKKVPLNRYGLYFERLINYGTHISNDKYPVNQLEHTINVYRGNSSIRRTALQASIFDPGNDHTTTPRRGFPCLQHVLFTPNTKMGELTITGLYVTQYIFDRAYGNYLGLYYLGCFMAHEMNLRLSKVCCFANQAKLGNISKRDSIAVIQQIKALLD
jgi:hypothetical protein